MRRVMLVVAAAAVSCIMASSLHAQVDTGAILGTVKDSSGAAVAGAKVNLRLRSVSAPVRPAHSR